MLKTSEGETVKGPEFFLESQKKLRLSRNIVCVSLFLFMVPLRRHTFSLPPLSPVGEVSRVYISILSQQLTNTGTCFYATKQKPRLCLLAKFNFKASQETIIH